MEFAELEEIRRFLQELKSKQVASLSAYFDEPSGGFYHRLDENRPGEFSKASTATCILSLASTGNWSLPEAPWSSKRGELAKAIAASKWNSAGLQEDNVFTVSFMLEALTTLLNSGSLEVDASISDRQTKAETIIVNSLTDGYAHISPYPPSAYVTQLAVRALLLHRPEALAPELRSKVVDWATRETEHQLALLSAHSKSADVFQLAYSVILATTLRPSSQFTPTESAVLDTALSKIFDELSDLDGTWPRSRPLFHYPKVGNAYCYEYELLTQLLNQSSLQAKLLKFLPKLRTAAFATRETQFPLDGGGYGWSSGHHPQLRGPESWSTASVFHFAHAFERLLAEAIRRAVFHHMESPYSPPRSTTVDGFAPRFLDCELKTSEGQTRSLKTTVFESLVKPIADQAARIEAGLQVPDDTPTSAILFGPPGTSKTEICSQIAQYLNWPLLSIDPSHLVSDGMDRVYAEADRIFRMLAVVERVVVLLDEFDEMVRERGTADDVLSRFLTTAMLPKLATINKNRRLLFVVATNHIEHFDVAISRPGRFDVILQVMPPTLDAKLAKWPGVKRALDTHGVALNENVTKKLGELTYLEFKVLANRLESAATAQEVTEVIDRHAEACTLNVLVDEDPKRTWAAVCSDQIKKVRLP